MNASGVDDTRLMPDAPALGVGSPCNDQRMSIVDSLNFFDAPSLEAVIEQMTAALGRPPTVSDRFSTEWHGLDGWSTPYIRTGPPPPWLFDGEPLYNVSIWHPDLDFQHAETRRLFAILVAATTWSIEADVNDDDEVIARRFDLP